MDIQVKNSTQNTAGEIDIRTESKFKGLLKWLLNRETKKHIKFLIKAGLIEQGKPGESYFTVNTIIYGRTENELGTSI